MEIYLSKKERKFPIKLLEGTLVLTLHPNERELQKALVRTLIAALDPDDYDIEALKQVLALIEKIESGSIQ